MLPRSQSIAEVKGVRTARHTDLSSLILLGTFAFGTVGYRMLEGVGETWMDAACMTANVLATVGFREAVSLENNQPAQLFTMLLLAPYVVTIIVVAGLVGKVRGPRAEGVPFIKS